jgi:hypothetical protein
MNSGLRLRTIDRECNHFAEAARTGGDHDEPIKPEGDANTARQSVLHCRQQATIFRQFALSVGLAESVVLPIPFAKYFSIEQLVIAVR